MIIFSKGKYYDENRPLLELVLPLHNVASKSFIPLFVLLAIAYFLYNIPYPIFPLAILLLTYLLFSNLFFWLIKQGSFPGIILYCLLLLVYSVLAALTAYYTGGIESITILLYAVICTLAGLTLPLGMIVVVTVTSVLVYLLELELEIGRIIPHLRLYPEFFPSSMYPSSAYIRIIPMAHVIVGVMLVILAYTVANILKQRTALLVRRDQERQTLNQTLNDKVHELETLKMNLEKIVQERTAELETAKVNLELKIKERTAELIREKASLADKIKERTAELESKVEELQQFYDTTVGRELKMIELEKENDELRLQLGKEPKHQ
jgi:hypothetical protein